jgi:hypothetical protein
MKRTTILAGCLVLATLALRLQAQTSLTNGLIACYPFNGNANDESGQGSDAVVASAALTENRFGEANKAYHFNGSGDRISAVNAQLPLGNSPRTLVTWLKPEGSMSVNWGVIHQGQQDCPEHMFGLSLQTAGNLGFWGGCQDWTSTLMSTNNQWYFVALTYDGAAVRLCVNGNWQTNAIGTLNTLVSRLWIGAETVSDGSYCRSYYRAVIDDVRLDNRALSTAEVESLYALESAPQVRFVQAFTVDCANLTVGSN